jgi:hypothetical protein
VGIIIPINAADFTTEEAAEDKERETLSAAGLLYYILRTDKELKAQARGRRRAEGRMKGEAEGEGRTAFPSPFRLHPFAFRTFGLAS